MSWTPVNTEEQEVMFSSDNTGVLSPYRPVANCSSYLSAKGKLGQLLHRKGIKWFSSGLHLHPAQHRDDGGHNQSQEATDIDDDVGVFGFHGIHRVCCFLFYRNKPVNIMIMKYWSQFCNKSTWLLVLYLKWHWARPTDEQTRWNCPPGRCTRLHPPWWLSTGRAPPHLTCSNCQSTSQHRQRRATWTSTAIQVFRVWPLVKPVLQQGANFLSLQNQPWVSERRVFRQGCSCSRFFLCAWATECEAGHHCRPYSVAGRPCPPLLWYLQAVQPEG